MKLSRITCYFPYAAEDEEKILRALRAACEVDVPQEKISYHHSQYRCKLVNEFNTPGLPDKVCFKKFICVMQMFFCLTYNVILCFILLDS